MWAGLKPDKVERLGEKGSLWGRAAPAAWWLFTSKQCGSLSLLALRSPRSLPRKYSKTQPVLGKIREQPEPR